MSTEQIDLESRIGQYWLSRIGTGVLVVGIASLMGYAFQHFGPGLKIGFGYLCALLLLWLSNKFENNTWRFSLPGMAWYGRTLAGGGWALAYFTTYAMHHIESVRIIDSPVLDLALLMGVAAGSLWHSLRRDSEVMALLSAVLGYLTICLSTMTPFSLSASTILLIALAVLVYKKRWYNLYLAGIIGSYASYWISIRFGVGLFPEQVPVTIGAMFNLASWFVFNSLAYCLDEEGNHRAYLVIAALLNGVALLGIESLLCPVLNIPNSALLAIFGCMHIVSGLVARGLSLNGFGNLQLVSGLTAATAAIPAHFDQRWSVLSWSFELALLTWVGLEYNIRPIRWFALAFSVPAFLNGMLFTLDQTYYGNTAILFRVVVLFAMSIAFGITAWLYRLKRYREVLGSLQQLSNVFAVASGLALWLLIGQELVSNRSLQLALWCVEIAALYVAGQRFSHAGLRYCALVLSSLTTICYWLLPTFDHAFYTCPQQWAYVLFLYLCAIFIKKKISESAESNAMFGITLAQAMINMWVASAQMGVAEWTVTLAAFEALSLLVLGVYLNSRATRVLAFIQYGLVNFFIVIAAGSLDPCNVLTSVACTFLGSLLMFYLITARRHSLAESPLERWNLGWGMVSVAVATIAHPHVGLMSIAWILQAAAFLAAGFLVNDKTLRLIGLGGFAILIGKLLLVDFAGAETLVRIVSFIMAGLALLIASYFYTWFNNRMTAWNDQNSAASTNS